MIKKKNENSNLEKKKILFFEIGIMISLAILLLAFESGTHEIEKDFNGNFVAEEISEDLIIQRTEREPPKPKPPMKPIIFDVIKDVEAEIDEIEIDWTNEIDVNADLFPIETDKETVDVFPIFIVENMPKYHGKDKTFFQKHLQQLVEYPEEAQNADIEGRVTLQFVVDEKGQIIDEKIVKSPHPSLSEAVLTALNKTDRWKPGEQAGIKVKVTFYMPIYFKLN